MMKLICALLFIFSSLFITADDRPNIIIILADDLGYADVGYHGSKEVPTPYIDSIANSGVTFTTGYAAAPVCGPSRAGLLAGYYQNRFGYQDNIGPYGRSSDTELGTPIHTKTIGHRFQEIGYKTAMIGKWHDGDDKKFWPHNRGFDEYFGFNNGAANYFIGKDNGTANEWGAIHHNEERLESVGDYLTDVFGDESADYVRRNKDSDKPFLMYLAYNAPHGPLQAPKRYMEKFQHIKNIKRRKMVAMTYAMDLNIGKLLNALKETNQEENTLIFFYSDNGGKPKGNHSYNMPLRGMKGQTYEGGIRVPFNVQWKARIDAGQKFDDPVHAIDIMKTALSAAGKEAPDSWKLEGVDLLPLMTSQVDQLENRYLYWRLNTNWAIRDRDWKLTGMNGNEELFHISHDISESKNLIKQYPEIYQRLKNEIKDWDNQNEKARWGWNKNTCPHWIGYREHQSEEVFLRKKNKK